MKYVTRQYSVSTNEWGEHSVTADEVIECDRPPRQIGILDQFGQPLYRQHETVPFGFRGRVR